MGLLCPTTLLSTLFSCHLELRSGPRTNHCSLFPLLLARFPPSVWNVLLSSHLISQLANFYLSLEYQLSCYFLQDIFVDTTEWGRYSLLVPQWLCTLLVTTHCIVIPCLFRGLLPLDGNREDRSCLFTTVFQHLMGVQHSPSICCINEDSWGNVIIPVREITLKLGMSTWVALCCSAHWENSSFSQTCIWCHMWYDSWV